MPISERIHTHYCTHHASIAPQKTADDLTAACVLWGKTRPAKKRTEENKGITWHSLLYHMIDIGYCAQVMWEQVVAPATRSLITNGVEADSADWPSWLGFLAGLHDLGKAGPQFQSKVPAHKERLTKERFPFKGNKDAPGQHGDVTVAAGDQVLTDRKWHKNLAESMLVIVGGHHGRFPVGQTVRDLRRKHRPWTIGKGKWEQSRNALVAILAETFNVGRLDAPKRESELDPAPAMVLAGLVSVADWIGSDETIFKYQQGLCPTCYSKISQESAKKAVEQLAWVPWQPRPDREFTDLFGWNPRPLQTAARDVSSRQDGPALLVIEAPTGEGKTEAALLAARHFAAAQGLGGIYTGLPTQATSNQMFKRVHAYLEKDTRSPLVGTQLVHGNARRNDLFAQMLATEGQPSPVIPQIEAVSGEEDAQHAHVVAQEWFTRRKRGLLAPFGVGTVDQALLGILKTRHVFVRLFGLAQKVVVIDEVHAYDTYMTTHLERLLEWLGAIGTSVILLSATLPRDRTKKLCAAFARGIRQEITAAAPTTDAYPMLTGVDTNGTLTQHPVSVASHNQRQIVLRTIGHNPDDPDNPDGPDGLACLLQQQLDGGGIGALICNTVQRAQERYKAVSSRLHEAGIETILLHARFPQAERAAREQQVLSWCDSASSSGTAGTCRPGRVVIATQIIEQSLDLDFDFMLTDLAPIDLLLQRAGRLHRHPNTHIRPSRLTQPQLCVIDPTAAGASVPTLNSSDKYIYDAHILLRTWLWLQTRTKICIPEDVRPAIKAVYGPLDTENNPAPAETELGAMWTDTAQKLRCLQNKQQERAYKRELPSPHSLPDNPIRLEKYTDEQYAEEAPEIHPALQALTRLTERTVTLACLYRQEDGSTSFDREGKDPLALNTPPSTDQVEKLLDRSLRCSTHCIVTALTDRKNSSDTRPKAWSQVASLRAVHAIFFRRHHIEHEADDTPKTAAPSIAQVGDSELELDPDLGLIIHPHTRNK